MRKQILGYASRLFYFYFFSEWEAQEGEGKLLVRSCKGAPRRPRNEENEDHKVGLTSIIRTNAAIATNKRVIPFVPPRANNPKIAASIMETLLAVSRVSLRCSVAALNLNLPEGMVRSPRLHRSQCALRFCVKTEGAID